MTDYEKLPKEVVNGIVLTVIEFYFTLKSVGVSISEEQVNKMSAYDLLVLFAKNNIKISTRDDTNVDKV